MFRYALFAHAIGLPQVGVGRASMPAATHVPDVNDSCCAVAVNPDFRTPRTNTGHR